MAEKNWFQRYWWISLLALIVLFVIGTGYFGMLSPSRMMASKGYNGGSYDTDMYEVSGSQRLSPSSNQDFAPEVEERQLIKKSSISAETKRGAFDSVQANVNNIIKASGAIVLSENYQVMGQGGYAYKTNSYQIKIETSKYDSVVAQLRALGGISLFTESATDVTGAIINRQVEIAAEKERLRRYEALVSSSAALSDKILLTDRIFEQDRRIKYLESGLQNTQQQVAYSTISLRLQEKAPMLYGVTLVGMGNLAKTLVGSLNALLYFIFALLPWAAAVAVIWLIIRFIRHHM